MSTITRRFLPIERYEVTAEPRSDQEGNPALPEIRGTAAVYFNEDDHDGTVYRLGGKIFERIMSTAFDEIHRDDVRGLQNHDPRLLLGRSVNGQGTMQLKRESHGLVYVIDTPNTTVGRDTVVSLERGDMTGSSFAFQIEKRVWTEGEDDDGPIWYRDVQSVRTADVGPVTYPAYLGTDSGVRGFRSACITRIDQRSVDSEIEAVQAELQTHIREHYHEPQRRERERVLRMLTI